jgi:hypothetical protein
MAPDLTDTRTVSVCPAPTVIRPLGLYPVTFSRLFGGSEACSRTRMASPSSLPMDTGSEPDDPTSVIRPELMICTLWPTPDR